MARETKARQATVARVMHEWKHGELTTTAGETVTDRRQAIAIGLSEAGASNERSPAQNRWRRRDTATKERAGDTGRARAEGGPSKAQLYAEARRRNVPGRSGMSKAELREAVEG